VNTKLFFAMSRGLLFLLQLLCSLPTLALIGLEVLTIHGELIPRGYDVFFGFSLIVWSTHKQAMIFRSSTEFEYKAVAHAFASLVGNLPRSTSSSLVSSVVHNFQRIWYSTPE
jgi:hypothetical protein